MKALESARAELPRQSIVQYKELLGFKEGLKRMGRVTYEYGYQVALARFHPRHPNAEVEEDPFTIHPEDDLVLMERQQAFDDSWGCFTGTLRVKFSQVCDVLSSRQHSPLHRCQRISPVSDNFDDSVRALLVRSQLPAGSSWVTDLSFSKHQVTHLDVLRMHLTVV
ncbi:hypothetical protein B296_00031881 [Ensete ventricosum]|uniref:Uncharacterized protein n=1 Tax=Ensete ventricosum TaxID=4639 RepID=A0A426XCZ9_ENSVE|nr:hypothetical protein B296_00031881 [Ensete ventricosum]